MSMLMPERLYQLLPVFLRNRDLDQGEPLRALLAVIETELERVERDTSGLYDNWFIETCDEWVVPYIGDLLGVRPIRAIESARVSARAYVADTIAYRRRKGTAVVLEQLARDTTGWPARAVEFFMRLATTQHMNHVRLAPHATPGVRNAAIADLADGAFDAFSHTLEVRNAATRGGRFNIPNVGIYLWRLQSYAVGSGGPGDPAPDFASARRVGNHWSIHPVGCDSPLFNLPRTETSLTHLAEEHNVPGELRRLALNAELGRLRRGIEAPAPVFMTARDPVLRVFLRLAGESVPTEVPREDIYIGEIPDEVELASPTPRALALDPECGRIGFPTALDVAEVWLQNSYGFSGDLGGGPYDRSAAARAASNLVAVDIADEREDGGFFDSGVWQVGVSHLQADDGSGTLFGSLRDAVAAWNIQPPGRTGVIVLMDSLSGHDLSASGGQPLQIEIAEGSRLLIVAGEWPLEPIPGAPPGSVRRVAGHFEAVHIRAHFIGDLAVRGTAPANSPNAGACFVNGLIVEGALSVAPGDLGRLELAHCTVVPGRGSVHVASGGNERLELSILRSIVAAISVPDPIRRLEIIDSIAGDDSGSPDFSVDAPQSPLELLRSSFFGRVTGQSLSASDCIFADVVLAAAPPATGCVRFSFVPPGSRVPRRYRCLPDSNAPTIRPLFESRRYGDPEFGQLELRCAPQIRTGAESGAEMGAFEFLKQPQREANLRDALAEYLRFGLEARLTFVT